MAKTRTPAFSLSAIKSIGSKLTFQKKDNLTMVRATPSPSDPKTLLQMYQRWQVQDYVAYWQTLSDAQKLVYFRAGARNHRTPVAEFLKEMLTDLPDIAGRWRLDEKSGTIAHDSSRNTNHGTIFGATHHPGYIDYALSFDGIDDRVDCGNDPSIYPKNALTLAFWFKLNGSLGVWQHLGQFTFNLADVRFQVRSNNMIEFYGVTDDGLFYAQGSTPVSLATWYHYAATYDKDAGPDNAKVYLDGQLQATKGTQTGPLRGDPATFYLAYVGTYSPISLDHVTLYNRALSQPEILLHSGRRYPL